MMNINQLLDRKTDLFSNDLNSNSLFISEIVLSSRFLVIGAAGSIGQAVSRELFKRNPKALHLVDISENNLVELVRDLRSSIGYIDGDFQTFAIDCGSKEFESLISVYGPYDYVFNLSALKHVRSEKDPFTLMRMIRVNILNTLSTLRLCNNQNLKKYFCVSTDKAANPVNLMGASKKIMEMFLMRESELVEVSTARFANVAFSDGSLLHGFNQRIIKNQPLAAPRDILRYFITPQESGELCLLSGLLGKNRDIFFPKLSPELHLITFSQIAKKYLLKLNYEPYECSTEQEAREMAPLLIAKRKWPCYFFDSDTTGEKSFEEFYTDNEDVVFDRFTGVGVIKNCQTYDAKRLEHFSCKIYDLLDRGYWSKNEIFNLFNEVLNDFSHLDTGKYLEGRM